MFVPKKKKGRICKSVKILFKCIPFCKKKRISGKIQLALNNNTINTDME